MAKTKKQPDAPTPPPTDPASFRKWLGIELAKHGVEVPPDAPAIPTWITLTQTYGDCYLRTADIVSIGAPFSKRGHDESRQIGTTGGLTIFALNTPENYETLKAAQFPTGDAKDWGIAEKKAEPAKGKRGRPAKAEAEPSTGASLKKLNKTRMRLIDELERDHKLLPSEPLNILITGALLDNPDVTAATIADLWRGMKG